VLNLGEIDMLTIGLFGDASAKGGAFDVLGSFATGLHDALKSFEAQGLLRVAYMCDWVEREAFPQLAIAFSVSGNKTWKQLMHYGCSVLMWDVDSPFWAHPALFHAHQHDPSFSVVCVSPAEKEAMATFLPGIPFSTLHHATSTALWQPADTATPTEKPYSVSFLGTIDDEDTLLNELKNHSFTQLYGIALAMTEWALNHRQATFWEVYTLAAHQFAFNPHNEQTYCLLLHYVGRLVRTRRRVAMVQQLQGLPVHVWGNAVWQRYATGSLTYHGPASVQEATRVVAQSQLTLHSQPIHIAHGLHERPLNALASGTFCLANTQPSFDEAFAGYLGSFENETLGDVATQVAYWLTHHDEREARAAQGQQHVLAHHTWHQRVTTLLSSLVASPIA
jgi:hypothetical protein